MSFNPLQNFNQGFASGQHQRINGLQSALSGQMQDANFMPSNSNDFLALSASDPQRAATMLNTFKALSNERKTAYHEDLQQGLRALESGDGERFKSIMTSRIETMKGLKGADPSGSQFLLDKYEAGDIQGLVTGLKLAEQAGISDGYLPKAPTEMDEIALEKARLELDQLRDGSVVDPEFLKEERKVARDSVTDFNKRASEIRSSYGKVETVLNSGPLNRMKIASAMTSMARLLSPGIVTNQDFQNLSDSADPVALVLSTLTGKGDAGKGIATELQKYYDPTNPELFDKESFLQTALSVAGAEIPTLLGSFEDAKSRAQRAGLRQRAIDTAFGENKNIKALTDMIGGGDKPVFNHPILGGVTESQIKEAMKNKNLTREQVINKLKGG